MKPFHIFLIPVILLLSGCVQQAQPVACTQEAKLCPDGSYVERVPPNCGFAPCPFGGNEIGNETEDEKKQNYCTPESRQAEICIQLYKPVCGWFNPEKIQCIRYPCAQTFSNSCFACGNENVLYWTEGECPE